MNTDGKVRRKGLGVRRKTIDGRRLTAAQAHARSSPVVGRSSIAQVPSFRRPAGDRNQTARGAFLAPSALFGAAWAARRKASPPLALIHIFLNSKLRIQNLQFPGFPPPVPSRLLALRAFGRPLLQRRMASSIRPTQNCHPPRSLVTPAASDNLLRRRDVAKISERVRKLESERAKYAHPCALIALVDLLTFLHSHLLTARLRVQTQPPNGAGDAHSSLRYGMRPAPCP
jgi:hypothetical protein